MRRIFLFPTEMEAAKFRTAAPDAECVVCGVGMAASAAVTARLVQGLGSGGMVILAGVAGGYDLDKTPMCQVFEVVSERIEELPKRFAEVYEIEPKFGLPCVSSNSVNRSNFVGASSDIENMEGAAVVAICQSCGVEVAEIRAISNRVGDHFEQWDLGGAIDALTQFLITLK